MTKEINCCPICNKRVFAKWDILGLLTGHDSIGVVKKKTFIVDGVEITREMSITYYHGKCIESRC